jgi:hypothetical protein
MIFRFEVNPSRFVNNFRMQEPFPHHAAEHGKSERDNGTL